MITFVVPSLGRPTLAATVRSLKNQQDPDWKAIIVFDGAKSTITDETDSRITAVEIQKVPTPNAGDVRNFGIRSVTTEWTGFVDDDDTLLPHYITQLKYELNRTDADVVIFQMRYSNGGILPPIEYETFYEGCVGISFCLKTDLAKQFLFNPSCIEDYDLLNRLRTAGKRIHISHNVTYLVRPTTDIVL